VFLAWFVSLVAFGDGPVRVCLNFVLLLVARAQLSANSTFGRVRALALLCVAKSLVRRRRTFWSKKLSLGPSGLPAFGRQSRLARVRFAEGASALGPFGANSRPLLAFKS
jgi:hypothetical protein